jgi:AcrR family transcriptional regulator
MEPVKTSVRRERARATRERILAVAYQLFATRGYQATTMPDIAAAAGVAVQTVYFVFHTKAILLEQVYATAVLGAEEIRPIDSEWYRRAVAETDSDRSLATMLKGVLSIAARLAPLAATMETIDDAEVRRVRTEKEALRRHLHRSYVAHLKKSRALRSDLTVDAATDLFLGLCSPMLFYEMTVRLGWPARRWESSLHDLLHHALLHPGLTEAGREPESPSTTRT